MATPPSTSYLTASQGYRLWADSYDRDANPMLCLERRVLAPLLPHIEGLDVIDIGCGTGRWMEALKTSGARSLVGIDLSPEMLCLAEAKLGDGARLICANYADVLLPVSTVDLLLCTFVLSYVENPLALLRLAKKALRFSGSLFLTDVHPETARALNWRRGVRAQSEFQEILTYHRGLDEIVAFCGEAGFELRVHLQPKFGESERHIFEANRKSEYFAEIKDYPAIYVLQLTPLAKPKRASHPANATGTIAGIRSAQLALGPSVVQPAELHIRNGRVQSISDCANEKVCSTNENNIDLSGYLVLPGLINAHDHLEFALFPRLGNGEYANFLEWAEDIHHAHASEIALHRQVPKHARLWWGGIRNLLCGVTTVCHHNPYEPEVFSGEFPVRVLKDFDWAHSLRLEPEAHLKKIGGPKGRRFFIHLAEGTDEQSAQELFDLHRAGALDAATVIIHGLGMGTQGRSLMRAAGAGLVWCPSSNLFLFGEAMPFDEIRTLPKVALGSDSPLTAQGDLLDEIRCAHQLLQTPSTQAYECVTDHAARLVDLKNGEGTIRAGGLADFIAVRNMGLSPAETLVTLTCGDIELVVLAGRVQLASPEMKQRLPRDMTEGLQALSIEGVTCWIRAPLDQLLEQTLQHLPGPIYLGGKRVDLGA
jgi:cytosine/adenosine deaminase-related metal-dependent hydrolase/ubiquinone/menaquinone biosynthesis C-methylase UbiE